MFRKNQSRRKLPRIGSLNRVETWLALILVAAIGYVLGVYRLDEGEEWSIPFREEKSAQDTNVPPIEGPEIPLTGETIRFVSYNVCNYFVDENAPGGNYRITIKGRESRDAVAETIKQANPDIVGLCEVGSQKALKDIQGRLKKLGVDLPVSYVLARKDDPRALAILSKYPIIRNNSQPDVPLQNYKNRKMLRGILDVTIGLPDQRQFRFVGVHLKSKKDTDGTAEHVRRLEAHALRLYLQNTRSGIPLLVFGDFNDSPNSPAVQIIMGNRKAGDGFRRLNPRDSRGETWTLKYNEAEAYYSYDHLLIDNNLQKRTGRNFKAGIIDRRDYTKASDHRALWVDIK